MARKKKNDEAPIENQDNQDNQDNLSNPSDDTFGLPEVEYEPLKRDQTEPPVDAAAEEPVVEEPVQEKVAEEPVYERPYETTETTPTDPVEETVAYEQPVQPQEHYAGYSGGSYAYEPEKPSPWPKVLGIGLIILLLLGGVYYFAIYKPEQVAKKELELKERNAAAAAERKRRAEALAAQQQRDAEQRRLDSLNAIPKVGTLEVLSQRTGQYYVVVASAIDDDLLTDFANRLVSEGKSVKLIPPFGRKGKFYRLAVDSKETYEDAQALADGMKGGDFGDQLWVVRY
jgi:hypothetical protein